MAGYSNGHRARHAQVSPPRRKVAPADREIRLAAKAMNSVATATVLEWARKVQAIAQSGLAFTQDPFDRERYQQLQELVTRILNSELGVTPERARGFWEGEGGYATPKVDVRGAVFVGEQVLLVRERSDGRWTLPGGWVDVNDSPAQAVEREILEESGYRAHAVKLAALVDKNRHAHPPGIHHIYKLMFLCDLTGGAARTGPETDAVAFYPVTALPELSTHRILRSQIERLYQHRQQPSLPTDFD